jgi:hypothetical protein
MKLTESGFAIRPTNDGRKEQGPARRTALTDKMVRTVRSHNGGVAASALKDYTFARDETENACTDSALEIFDGAGTLVFQGNEFDSGIAGYWRPSKVSLARGSSSQKTWGRQSAPSFVG